MTKVLMVKGNTETYVDELLVEEYEENDWEKVELKKESKAAAKTTAEDKATSPKK